MTVKAEQVAAGRYRVRIYIGTHPVSGKPIQRSRYFRAKNQREANRLAAEHEAALRQGRRDDKATEGTVGELVDLWVKHRAAQGDSPTTVYRRASIVAAIKREIGRIRVDQLTSRQIDDWYDTLRSENLGTDPKVPRHRSESTIHHYHRVLHAILEQAYQWEMTDRLPAHRASVPKRKKSRPSAPTPEVVRLLLNEASPDLAVMAWVLAATGMRRGELIALRVEDLDGTKLRIYKSAVDLPGKAVTIKAPKNDDSVRIVELDDGTLAVLAAHIAGVQARFPNHSPASYVFPDPLASDDASIPRRPDWVTRAWTSLCAKHGVKIKLHGLRHFHVTQLLDLGISLPAVAARVGHGGGGRTTIAVYGHATEQSDASAAKAIGGVIRPS